MRLNLHVEPLAVTASLLPLHYYTEIIGECTN